MPQLSLYLDSETMESLRSAAAARSMSLSEFARTTLKNGMKSASSNPWPKSLWDSFGAVDDESFSEPAELAWELDGSCPSFD